MLNTLVKRPLTAQLRNYCHGLLLTISNSTRQNQQWNTCKRIRIFLDVFWASIMICSWSLRCLRSKEGSLPRLDYVNWKTRSIKAEKSCLLFSAFIRGVGLFDRFYCDRVKICSPGTIFSSRQHSQDLLALTFLELTTSTSDGKSPFGGEIVSHRKVLTCSHSSITFSLHPSF